MNCEKRGSKLFFVDDTVTFLAINGEIIEQIGDQQQRWGYEEGPWMTPGPRRSAGGRLTSACQMPNSYD